MTEILQTLKEYIPISLEEMSGIKLMNRTDTKYVTSYQMLKEILLVARHDYRIQEVNGEYNIAYHNITKTRTKYRSLYRINSVQASVKMPKNLLMKRKTNKTTM